LDPNDPRRWIEPLVREFLRLRYRHLLGNLGLNPDDLADLRQELRLAAWSAAGRLDRSRGRDAAFFRTVLNRCTAKFLRGLFTPKRDRRRERPHADLDGSRCARKRRVADDPGQSDLQIDLEKVLGKLSPRERRLAELLKTHSLAGAARALATPRTTLASAVRRLRRRFEAAGLRIYVDRFTDPVVTRSRHRVIDK